MVRCLSQKEKFRGGNPSNSRVCKGKYLQLKYTVSMSEKISICLNRGREESVVMMTFLLFATASNRRFVKARVQGRMLWNGMWHGLVGLHGSTDTKSRPLNFGKDVLEGHAPLYLVNFTAKDVCTIIKLYSFLLQFCFLSCLVKF